MDEESREEAWKVLAQLYPLDSQGNPLEQGLQQTLFGQLYLQGAAARSHCTAPGYKPNQGGTHAVASTPSAVPVSITHEPPTMPAGSIAETNTALQQPISAFEGMDVVMQGSPWFEGMMAPSTALSAWVRKPLSLVSSMSPCQNWPLSGVNFYLRLYQLL